MWIAPSFAKRELTCLRRIWERNAKSPLVSKSAQTVVFFIPRIINELIPYNEFTRKCLNVLKPSKQVCEGCLQSYPYQLVDYIQELINACKEKKKEVFLVSGGFVPMITPLLRILHIDESHLFAIPLRFDSEGRFLGFDETATVTRLDGKGIIAKE